MSGLCVSLIGPALCQSVDFYCERTSASLFAEPLNAVSNLAFIVAGWFAWREFLRDPSRRDDPLITWLIVLMPVVGLGSLTFHTVGTQWASWADVIPILIFGREFWEGKKISWRDGFRVLAALFRYRFTE